MRLATLKDGTAVLLSDTGAVALEQLGFRGSLLDLAGSGAETKLELGRKAAETAAGEPIDSSEVAAPIGRPPKIVAIGLNYSDHADESQMELPKSPLVFTKFSSSVTGPSDPIELPAGLSKEVDYEVELGVVIGRTAKNVGIENALEYVFGYTVVNDVSARDLQFADQQWVRGKSLDTFCPMGPAIVTADEIPDPQALNVGCAVNGQILQQANTRDMIFGVADLVSRLSHSFTLEPGDVIATGTPSGVGFSRKPPIYLRPGDSLRTWVEGIGELLNPVAEAP